jgi:hypothetical protein
LKKEAKNFFQFGVRAFSPARTQTIKVFFASFLFTKKKALPAAQNHRTGHRISELV